ncbi:hypothetical protein NF556_04170 [Ornithinimicrobium faecis]|uniref:Uncharacterized protein n=1 Tax=Ornithinimicrobium faecis TaxID=2934158 RepID=A0ABY4YVU3_9MICO|nr:hypothetical protein [Ornithinimicrobium sp. HY1793]USQ80858.1 hypothetical protein NF556_04170 [Ornithinimicrobium sp. HY1793]
MNEFEDDEVLARLRAADPAQGAHPDLHRLSERLRGRTPLGSQQHDASGQGLDHAAGHSFSHTSDTAVRVQDPHARTGRGGLLVAASVAALALAGGGYAVGAGVAGDDDPQGTVASQETDGPGDSRAAADDGAMEDHSSAESYSASEDSGGGGSFLGPVIPVAGEALSTERTTGEAYAPAGGASSGAADQLRPYAEGLGMEGEVQDYGSGADLTDSTDGRALNVYQQGGLTSFDYSNPALDSWCQESMDQAKDLDYSPFGEGGPQEIECVTLGDPPTDDQAIAEAQELLDRAGVDYAGYDFSVDSGFGWFGTDPALGDVASATAEPDSLNLDEHYAMIADQLLADGEGTDVSVIASDPDSPVGDYRTWHFSVTSAGVSSASVQLGELVALGDYEVISPTEAVERANDVRFQQLGVYIPDLDYDELSYDEEWEEPEPLPAVQPGGSIPFPLGEATVTGAELHTGVLSLWDGTEFLVPAWNLTDADGNSWQVLGLTEDALDFTP